MARSRSSSRWLKEPFDDACMKMAQKEGWCSRASCKLLELQEKKCLLHPDMTVVDFGARATGRGKAMHLCELALGLASRVLCPAGDFLLKIFQGEGFDGCLKDGRGRFDKVQMRKPLPSREQYLLARGLRADDT